MEGFHISCCASNMRGGHRGSRKYIVFYAAEGGISSTPEGGKEGGYAAKIAIPGAHMSGLRISGIILFGPLEEK